MLKRLAAVAAAGLAAGGLLLAAPAQADTFPVSGWEVIDTASDGGRTTSAHSAIVDATTADATWQSDETASAAGTSIEAADLAASVGSGVTVTVDYELLDGASPAAGSVRLFIYYSAGADTWSTAPDQFVAAPDDGSTSGTLSITTDQAGTIGTIGMVYDTSNGGVDGTVRFTDLTVDGESILFVEPEEPPAEPPPGMEEPEEPIVLDPTDPATFDCETDLEFFQALVDEFGIDVVVEAFNSAEFFEDTGIDFEPDLTAEHLEAFFERCADDGQGGGDGDDDEKPDLPATSGSPLPMLIGGGLLLMLAGGTAMLLARRRRVTIG